MEYFIENEAGMIYSHTLYKQRKGVNKWKSMAHNA